MTKGRGGKQALLQSAIDYVAAHGVGDRSLREIAAELGSSHRMLIYHFGSKEGLLVEIIRVMEQRQRALLEELDDLETASPLDVAREFWQRVADPALWPYERLFFEVYGRALQGDPESRPLLDGVIDAWLDPLARAFRRAGMHPDHARDHARLGLAVARGLLLDLLATGERAAVDGAMEQFITMYETVLENAVPGTTAPARAHPPVVTGPEAKTT
ncbi:TetR/AcrR family transcriptional regulator [Phytoactinopolyspora endophytica]|uniref:TetR/AcrR family transcriptional regulator n=1 Tax=Phytoactinopolyspora endophytica TaxID=1642495 RepID=UPI00101BB8D5|nr:TetR/AcrR family transcriptional regulator [Phytoactinopolyspora endophytica]